MQRLGIALPVVLAMACGGDEFEANSAGDGSSGSAATAGSTGSPGTGGLTAQAGSHAGGAQLTGGTHATGGDRATGGGTARGGQSARGGGTATGGEPAAGGSTASGGEPATGGGGSPHTGGTPSGGVPATGGSPGTGGATTGGAGGVAPGGGSAGALSRPECETPDDCALHSDCCQCTAHAANVTLPYCEMACTEEPCFTLRVTTDSVVCRAGHCSLAVSCRREEVSCYMEEPDCGAGAVASVVDECWGPCIDASDCEAVDSCEDCDPTRHVCVTLEAQLHATVCIEVPGECANKRDCDCLAPSTCIEPFGVCTDLGENQIACTSPTP